MSVDEMPKFDPLILTQEKARHFLAGKSQLRITPRGENADWPTPCDHSHFSGVTSPRRLGSRRGQLGSPFAYSSLCALKESGHLASYSFYIVTRLFGPVFSRRKRRKHRPIP